MKMKILSRLGSAILVLTAIICCVPCSLAAVSNEANQAYYDALMKEEQQTRFCCFSFF